MSASFALIRSTTTDLKSAVSPSSRRNPKIARTARIWGAVLGLGLTGLAAGAALTATATAQERRSPPAASPAMAAPEIHFRAYAADEVEPRISNFSGLPVPRYSSLRNAPVNGRAGPSLDYPVRWSYRLQGLPVIVVRESADWRKIRDPQGDEVWVHRRMLAGDRSVMSMSAGELHPSPTGGGQSIARYEAGVLFTLRECQGAWCEVETEGRIGWAPRAQLWGADDLPAARE